MELRCYKPGATLSDPWTSFTIDPGQGGPGHDVLFRDVDGDGVDELFANSTGGPTTGVYLYKRGADPTQPWTKHTVQKGRKEEGLAIVQLDGKGRWGLVSGPRLYEPPQGGPFAGPWTSAEIAPSHREMCRVAALDITGNGRDDIVIVDSEYFEGQLSWLENKMNADGSIDWIEHKIERGIYYGHSLHVSRDKYTGSCRIVLGEMAGGGWNAPYNFDARIIEYVTEVHGESWGRTVLSAENGVHEATLADIDGDEEEEIIGKEYKIPRVLMWKKTNSPSPLRNWRHQFIDRDKPWSGSDILAVDIDGDGLDDVACVRWWYHAPDWRRRDLPEEVGQVVNAFDIDGDGRMEIICTRQTKPGRVLSNELLWIKPVDPLAGKWDVHEIGIGTGDWPHGSLVAPLLPGGKLALVTSYHSAHASKAKGTNHYPDLWEIPADPAASPWPKRPLAEVLYGEEMLAFDVTGDGALDIVAGSWLLKNNGDGSFEPRQFVPDFYPARIAIADIAGNGRADVLMGKEEMSYTDKVVPWSLLVWAECPADPMKDEWIIHPIDKVRCAHSVAAADLDGDGEVELVCGEHDPFYPYRNRCHLYVYKKADPKGLTWKRYTLDDRFEHHDGTKLIDLGNGKHGILSHGWADSIYVHLWTPED